MDAVAIGTSSIGWDGCECGRRRVQDDAVRRSITNWPAVPFVFPPSPIMWRSIFLAFGIMSVVVGFETMVIDSANLYSASGTDASSFIDPSGVPSEGTRVWAPSEAFPFVVLAVGAIVILYAFTLPKRFARPAE